MKMVEKVARACCAAGNHEWPTTDGYNDRAEKRAWFSIARAAIEAMREPTDAMYEGFGADIDPEVFPGYWARAIDAALNEEASG